MDSAHSEIISWESEVDREEARLIRQGMPPWVAARQAVQIVQTRRQASAGVFDDQA